MASCLSLSAVARLFQAVGERRIAEIRKSAATGRDVERPVAAVRHLSLPRRPAYRHHGLAHGGDALGDVPKAVDLAGCDVERPPAAMLDHLADDFGHVIDQHVIASLLAFAEQHDLLPCRRQPTEAVGPVAVVRIPLAVDQGRTYHREWRLDGGLSISSRARCMAPCMEPGSVRDSSVSGTGASL